MVVGGGGGGGGGVVGLTILLKIFHLEQIKVLGLIISRINNSSRVLIIHTFTLVRDRTGNLIYN